MRNLIRAGVSQTVAMKISGHKTDATSRRYDITSTEDIADALKRTAEYVRNPRSKRRTRTELGPSAALWCNQ